MRVERKRVRLVAVPERRHVLRPDQLVHVLLRVGLQRPALRDSHQRLQLVAVSDGPVCHAVAVRLCVRVSAGTHGHPVRAAHQRVPLQSVQQQRHLRTAPAVRLSVPMSTRLSGEPSSTQSNDSNRVNHLN